MAFAATVIILENTVVYIHVLTRWYDDSRWTRTIGVQILTVQQWARIT